MCKLTPDNLLIILGIGMNFRRFLSIYSVVFAVLFVSCGENKNISSIERENLFTLNYGNFEDEINVYSLLESGSVNTEIFMQDGFFYILNGESKKIMEMNSYGNLITLLYNDEENIRPSFAGNDENVSATRQAVVYPFNELTSISVDSRKFLYVADRLPRDRYVYDSDSGMALTQVVLRFDENKKFIDYIGQKRPGGEPFPLINKIYTNENNELVVFCSTMSSYEIYWYSVSGFLIHKVEIERNKIPNPYSREMKDSYASLGNVVCDYEQKKLYLKVDYYDSKIDESSRVKSGVRYVSTLIYPLNVENQTFDHPISIPPYTEHHSDGLSNESIDIPYDFLGVTDDQWFYFIVSTDDGFSIQMVQSNGQRILKRRIPLNRADVLYYTFNLSREGIISALLVQKENASITWWRIDSLIQSILKS